MRKGVKYCIMTNQITEEIIQGGGKKIVRKVSIKNGKGYKSVTRYHKGKRVSSVKKPIQDSHIILIQSRKFIPGLFSDCHSRKQRRTRKNK
jgi:hypothetical protein